MAWTPAQEQAIATRNCGLIVSAAAGSGKTSVLVERLLRILMDDSSENRVPADRMIVVTFTSDAAAEMKSRLSYALDLALQQNPENRWLYQQQILLQSAHICTISSFCFDLIRENITENGITSDFRILSETESQMIAKRAADKVLNRWHKSRPKDMDLLWDCFCDQDDKPLEQILLELHEFLNAVSFRDAWEAQVLDMLQQPLDHSDYLHMFQKQLQDQAQQIRHWTEETVELAQTLYDDIQDNTVLPWVEDDFLMIRQFERILQEDMVEADALLQPFYQLKEKRGKKRFPPKKKNILDVEQYEAVKDMRKNYAKSTNELMDLVAVTLQYGEEDLEQHRLLLPLLFALEEELADEIWTQKVERNVLGFDDGERLALELLSIQNPDGTVSPSPLAKEMASYYELIMIDEYQDSNNKQDVIFRLLSHNCIDPETGALRYGDNVFLVGDVKQSIYRFRLANPQNFVQAIEATAQPKSLCHHITLNRNFRSTPAVLNFVNFVCGNLMSKDCGDIQYDESEALDPGSKLGDILPLKEQAVQVAVLSRENTETEAGYLEMESLYVSRQIQNMIAEKRIVVEKDGTTRPCRYSDFCVLLRANGPCRKLVATLVAEGVPVQSTEEEGYLRAREISILLDLLRILDNPHLDVAFANVMLSPIFNFTTQELLQIRAKLPKSELYQALSFVESHKALGGTEGSGVDSLLWEKSHRMIEMLQKLRQSMGTMSLVSFIRRIYDTTDFMAIMQITEEGEQKRSNLHLLLQYAKQYEENTDTAHSGVSGFLHYIDWLLENGKDFQHASISTGIDDAVVVKTMHRSKGLEFPFVFLVGLESSFSKKDAQKRAVFSDKGLAGLRISNPKTCTIAKTLPYAVIEQDSKNQAKSEELRLLYVSMTRAKQQLFLPLSLGDSAHRKNAFFEKVASNIQSDGTLPPSFVRSVGSMAHWIWACLLLLNPKELREMTSMPSMNWKPPAWRDNLQITYTEGFPAVAVPKSTESQQVAHNQRANVETVAQMERYIAFASRSSDSYRESQRSVSAVQESKHKRASVWKRPTFLQAQDRLTGAERGTAVHMFFQHADFKRASEDLEQELVRLQQYGFLSAAQAAVVTPDIVTAFLRDPIYLRLQKSSEILREKRFQICCNDLRNVVGVDEILGQYANSDTMLRGTIDMAFREQDAYILVDYKTDHVSEPSELVTEYRDQLLLYRAAIQVITGLPVTECYIYSTQLRKSILIEE